MPQEKVTGAMTLPEMSGLLLECHRLGLPGWRWLLMVEGLPAVLPGVATLWMIPGASLPYSLGETGRSMMFSLLVPVS